MSIIAYNKASVDTLLAGKVSTSRTIAGYPLTTDIVLSKDDIGLSNVDNTADVNKQVLSASKLTTARLINGVAFDGTTDIGITDGTKVPVTRLVNGHALNADVTLTAGDVSAVPTTRTVNGKALSADVTLAASDVGALTLSDVAAVATSGDYADLTGTAPFAKCVFTTSWPARPTADTVIYQGSTEAVPPTDMHDNDLWVRDA